MCVACAPFVLATWYIACHLSHVNSLFDFFQPYVSFHFLTPFCILYHMTRAMHCHSAHVLLSSCLSFQAAMSILWWSIASACFLSFSLIIPSPLMPAVPETSRVRKYSVFSSWMVFACSVSSSLLYNHARDLIVSTVEICYPSLPLACAFLSCTDLICCRLLAMVVDMVAEIWQDSWLLVVIQGLY